MPDTFVGPTGTISTFGPFSYQRWRWVDEGALLLFGYCDSDRTITVVFSEPMNITNVWDINSVINLKNWFIDSDKILPDFISVEIVDKYTFKLRFVNSLPSYPTKIRVQASTNIKTEYGTKVLKYYNTIYVTSAVPPKEKLIEAVESVIAFTDFDFDFGTDGIAKVGVTSFGDYAYATPLSAIRQFILRLIVTIAGEYLPSVTFGSGLVPKQLLRPHELAKAVAALKEKLIRLSFVEDTKIRAYTEEGGVVVIAVWVKTKANQQIEVTQKFGG
jgi:hypothetical protein